MDVKFNNEQIHCGLNQFTTLILVHMHLYSTSIKMMSNPPLEPLYIISLVGVSVDVMVCLRIVVLYVLCVYLV